MRKYKTEVKEELCQLESELITRLGANKTREKSFTRDFTVRDVDGDDIYLTGFYTYRGNVYILGAGMDYPYKDFSDEDKIFMHKEIMNHRYE